jgi:hypothetical protein
MGEAEEPRRVSVNLADNPGVRLGNEAQSPIQSGVKKPSHIGRIDFLFQPGQPARHARHPPVE